MLFLRELIAFCQITFIPGLLVIALIRPSFGKFRTLLLLPGLSLLMNYIFAGIALSLGIFTPLFSRLYAAAVYLAVLWLWRKELVACCKINCTAAIEDCRCRIAGSLKELFSTDKPGQRLLLTVSLLGCAGGLTVLFFWFFDNIDTVFLHWDSVLSWNTWARSWAKGNFPGGIGEYPQLLPINWAVAYHLIGEPIQFVPRSAICLIPLFTALFFVDYGISKKKIAMLLTVPLLAFYMGNISYFSHGGELDMLMVYYGAALLFIIFYAKESKTSGEFLRGLTLGVLVVCAAGTTKQAGLYLLFAFPLTAFFILRGNTAIRDISRRKVVLMTLGAMVFTGIIVAPGYAISIYRTNHGKNQSNFDLVTNHIYGENNPLDRFVCSARYFMLRFQSGISDVYSARYTRLDKSRGIGIMLLRLYGLHTLWGIVMIVFNIFVIISCWKIPEYRGLLVQTVIFFLIWSMFFCYDLRNLSLVISYIALLTALAIDRWWCAKERKLPLGYVVPGMFLLIFCCTPEKFLPGLRRSKFKSLQQQIGNPELNRQLYNFTKDGKFNKKIISDYIYMGLLPDLEKYICSTALSVNHETSTKRFLKALENPENGALLLPDYASENIQKVVKEYKRQGKLKKDFNVAGYAFYIIVR